MGFHQIMTIYLKIPVNNEWKIANRQILPFLIHFNQHLAILYADFLFFKHQADNVCIASWVSRKCINSFINFASSKLSFVADIFSSLSETVNYHLDEKNLRQNFCRFRKCEFVKRSEEENCFQNKNSRLDNENIMHKDQ